MKFVSGEPGFEVPYISGESQVLTLMWATKHFKVASEEPGQEPGNQTDY
jgi:hypothetical protein